MPETIIINIPVQLRQLTGGRDTLRVTKALIACNGQTPEECITLRHLIDVLDFEAPGLKNRLVDATGIRRFVNIFVDDADARAKRDEEFQRETQLDALNAKADPLDLNISAASEVTILPAIAGG